MAKKQSKKSEESKVANKESDIIKDVATESDGAKAEVKEEPSKKELLKDEPKKREVSDADARKAYKALSLSVRNDFNLKKNIKHILALSDKEDGVEALRDIIESGKVVEGLVSQEFIERAKEDIK